MKRCLHDDGTGSCTIFWDDGEPCVCEMFYDEGAPFFCPEYYPEEEF